MCWANLLPNLWILPSIKFNLIWTTSFEPSQVQIGQNFSWAISLVLATCLVAVCSQVKDHRLYIVILCLPKNVTFSIRYGSVLKAHFCADNKIPIPIKENLCYFVSPCSHWWRHMICQSIQIFMEMVHVSKNMGPRQWPGVL